MQLVILDQHHLDGELAAKGHIIDSLLVGRIGKRDEKLVAPFAQRQEVMLLHQLLVDDVFRQLLLVDGCEIEKGHTKLLGCQLCQRATLHQPLLNEIGHQRDFSLLGLDHGLLRCRLPQQLSIY